MLCTQNSGGPHAERSRHRPAAVRSDGENGSRRPAPRPPRPWPRIADVQLLGATQVAARKGNVRVPGVTGPVAARIETPAGAIIIGGKGQNTYQLDQMRDVAAVIDLGGGNTYIRRHRGSRIGPCWWSSIWAATTFPRHAGRASRAAPCSASPWSLNLGGNNVYEAQDVAQGSALAGVGMLVDFGRQQPLPRAPPRARPGHRRARHPDQPRRQERLSCRHVGPGLRRPAGIRTAGERRPATTIIIAAGCGAIPIPKRPATKAGARASAPASAKWPTAASA